MGRVVGTAGWTHQEMTSGGRSNIAVTRRGWKMFTSDGVESCFCISHRQGTDENSPNVQQGRARVCVSS